METAANEIMANSGVVTEVETNNAKWDTIMTEVKAESEARSKDTKIKDIVPEGGLLVEKQLYTCPLPEDYLLHGCPFALNTPLAPEPDQTLSDKQIARAREEEERIARLNYAASGRAVKYRTLPTNTAAEDATKGESENDGNDTPIGGDSKDDTTPTHQSSSEMSLEATQTTEWVVVNMVKKVESNTTDEPIEALEDPDAFARSTMLEQADAAVIEKASQSATNTKAEPKVLEMNSLEDFEREAKVRLEEEVKMDGLRRDPSLYPEGWFKNSMYDNEERWVRQNYVQDAETVHYRTCRILWMAIQLVDESDNGHGFFSCKKDEDGNHLIDVPGALSVPKPYFDAEMPEVIKRDGGVEVVYVDLNLQERVTKTDANWQRYIKLSEEREKTRKRAQEEKEKQNTEAAMDAVSAAIDSTAQKAKKEVGASEDIPAASQPANIVEQQTVEPNESTHDEVQEAVEAVEPGITFSDNDPMSAWELAQAAAESAGIMADVREDQSTLEGNQVKQYTLRRRVAGEGGATTKPTLSAAVPQSEEPAKVVPLTKNALERLPMATEAAEAVDNRKGQKISKQSPEPGKREEEDDDCGWMCVDDESLGTVKAPGPESVWSRLFWE